MKCILSLYITGCSLASQHAVMNLRLLCQNELKGICEYEIIDILENPEIAEQEKILATPTLVKRFPAPARKVIGDLSQRDKVLFGLGLDLRKSDRTNDPELLKNVSEEEVGQ
ncbi:MAG: circadian clock KaiB family protein [Rhodospirillaceae bacterium]